MHFILSNTLAGVAVLVSVAAAQNSSSAYPTVNLFVNDDLDGDAAYAASIVSACSDQTVYVIQCTSGPAYVDSATCGSSAPIFTLTEGPGTYEASVVTSTAVAGHTGAVEISEGCVLSGTTAASCVAELSVSLDGTSTKTQTTSLLTGDAYHRFDVAITGGADKTASATAKCTAPGKSGAMAVTARQGVMLGAVLAAGFVSIVGL